MERVQWRSTIVFEPAAYAKQGETGCLLSLEKTKWNLTAIFYYLKGGL